VNKNNIAHNVTCAIIKKYKMRGLNGTSYFTKHFDNNNFKTVDLETTMNKELLIRFFNTAFQKRAVSLEPAVDLLKAIFFYREYPILDDFLNEHQEMINQKKDLIILWNVFSTLNTEELSNHAIRAIHEISETEKLLKEGGIK